MNFDQAFTRLLGNEGAYSNRASDPGKETMWGVTVAVARASGYQGDMHDFTQEQAKAIYRPQYWDAVQADGLPDEVRFDVFDAAVNSGVSQAVKWLQRAVGVTDDGVIGPQTLAAAKFAPGSVTMARFNGYRLQFMSGLSAWPAFGRGWANRIAKNLMGA